MIWSKKIKESSGKYLELTIALAIRLSPQPIYKNQLYFPIPAIGRKRIKIPYRIVLKFIKYLRRS